MPIDIDDMPDDEELAGWAYPSNPQMAAEHWEAFIALHAEYWENQAEARQIWHLARIARNWSRVEMARLLGISRRSLEGIEKGLMRIRPEHVKAFSALVACKDFQDYVKKWTVQCPNCEGRGYQPNFGLEDYSPDKFDRMFRKVNVDSRILKTQRIPYSRKARRRKEAKKKLFGIPERED